MSNSNPSIEISEDPKLYTFLNIKSQVGELGSETLLVDLINFKVILQSSLSQSLFSEVPLFNNFSAVNKLSILLKYVIAVSIAAS